MRNFINIIVEAELKLSEAEQAAIDLLTRHGGSILQSNIAEKNTMDSLGFVIPGMNVFQRLEKKGLVTICEPLEDTVEGEYFEWTPPIEFTDAGWAYVRNKKKGINSDF